MRPIIRRHPLLRALRSSPNRFFTRIPQPRPQLPFLSQPRRHTRFLTTETRQWITSEVYRAGRWTVTLWTFVFLFGVMAFGLQQEYAERKFPSPHEWSFLSRMHFRMGSLGQSNDDDNDDGSKYVDWVALSSSWTHLLKRLEDPNIDGGEITDQDDGGLLIEGIGKTGYDISNKSEPWRRGYHQALMSAGKTAEHLDGWVRDKTRNLAFPAEVVIGPSNPNPRPVNPNSQSPPREEDCEPYFDPPEKYYTRIITTKGFTSKQKLEAALAYAEWLDYKGASDTALDMYNWSMDIALGATANSDILIDRKTAVIKPSSTPVPENLLRATTGLAVHYAMHSELSKALPIFLSVLRARRELGNESPSALANFSYESDDTPKSSFSEALSILRNTLSPPKYPSPPPDGTLPPVRDAKERCEEAVLMTYIGEILYTSKNRDDGLAWTRESVDVAEEQLQRRHLSKDAKLTCRECLKAGLNNWSTMVAQLTREEREKKANSPSTKVSGWLGFGTDDPPEILGRWESEENVIQERTRRVKDLLTTPPPRKGLGLFFV